MDAELAIKLFITKDEEQDYLVETDAKIFNKGPAWIQLIFRLENLQDKESLQRYEDFIKDESQYTKKTTRVVDCGKTQNWLKAMFRVDIIQVECAMDESFDAKISLVFRAKDEEDLERIKRKFLESYPKLKETSLTTGKPLATFTPYTMIPKNEFASLSANDSSLLPNEILKKVTRANLLQNCTHELGRSGTIDLFPYYEEGSNVLVVIAAPQLCFGGKDGIHQYMHLLSISRSEKPIKFSSTTYGNFYDPNNSKTNVQTQVGANISVGSSGVDLGASGQVTKTKDISDFQIHKRSGAAGPILMEYTYKLPKGETEVCSTKHIHVFTLEEPFHPREGKIRLDSTLMKIYPEDSMFSKVKSKVGVSSNSSIPSIASFGLTYIQAQYLSEKATPTQNRPVVLGLLGEPQVGKTSFVRALCSMFPQLQGLMNFGPSHTPYLQEHLFQNVYLKGEGQEGNGRLVNFKCMDPRGYWLRANREMIAEKEDEMIINMMLRGLPVGVDFSADKDALKELAQMPYNSNNAPTHVLLVLNGRNVWEGVYRYEGFGNDVINTLEKYFARYAANSLDDRIWSVSSMYEYIVKKFTEINSADILRAAQKVFVVFTHMDMIPEDNRSKAKETMRNMLVQKSRWAHSQIVFVEKTCAWNYDDLKEQDKMTMKVLTETKKGEDWKTVAEKIFYTVENVMHIEMEHCTKPSCEHIYTGESLKNLMAILRLAFGTELGKRDSTQ